MAEAVVGLKDGVVIETSARDADPVVGLKDGVVIETSARDAEICRLYISGLTMQQIGDHFQMNKERIRQILKAAGVYKTDRKKNLETVRHAFLGANISEADKVALCREAMRRGLSMSALTAEWISEKLAELSKAS